MLYPVGHGLIHAFFVRLRIGSHWSPVVVHPVSDDRPPVVVAFENVIQLITTTRAMLCAVDRAIAWIDCESLSVAMPIRPDAFDRAGRVDERIVIGRTAIVVEPEDLPFRVGEFLHLIHATTLTDDEVDVAPDQKRYAYQSDSLGRHKTFCRPSRSIPDRPKHDL